MLSCGRNEVTLALQLCVVNRAQNRLCILGPGPSLNPKCWACLSARTNVLLMDAAQQDMALPDRSPGPWIVGLPALWGPVRLPLAHQYPNLALSPPIRAGFRDDGKRLALAAD